MITLLLICGFLTIFHLFYESVVAPSIRVTLRFKIYALRDELRELMMDTLSDSERSSLDLIEESLNTAIRFLHCVTITSVIEANRQIEADPDLKKKIDKRSTAIQECPIVKAREIYSRASQIVVCGFLANSGGWFIYLIPIVITLFFISSLHVLLKKILMIKGYEMKAVVPEMELAPA